MQRLAKLNKANMDGGAGKIKAASAVKKFTRTAACVRDCQTAEPDLAMGVQSTERANVVIKASMSELRLYPAKRMAASAS